MFKDVLYKIFGAILPFIIITICNWLFLNLFSDIFTHYDKFDMFVPLSILIATSVSILNIIFCYVYLIIILDILKLNHGESSPKNQRKQR